MKEQEIKDLGFEIQRETIESSGYDTDWHYYTLDIGDICLITNSNDEVVKDEWEVSIFDFSSCVIKNIDDLKALVSIIKNNQQ
jgi:hypothetical protein